MGKEWFPEFRKFELWSSNFLLREQTKVWTLEFKHFLQWTDKSLNSRVQTLLSLNRNSSNSKVYKGKTPLSKHNFLDWFWFLGWLWGLIQSALKPTTQASRNWTWWSGRKIPSCHTPCAHGSCSRSCRVQLLPACCWQCGSDTKQKKEQPVISKRTDLLESKLGKT